MSKYPHDVTDNEMNAFIENLLNSNSPSIDKELYNSTGKKSGRYRNSIRKWAREAICLNEIKAINGSCRTCSKGRSHSDGDYITAYRSMYDTKGKKYDIRCTLKCSSKYGLGSNEHAYVNPNSVCLCYEPK